MADSVYISENLGKTQIEFLKLLDENEIQRFKFSEIENQINQKFENLNEVLANLVHKQLLTRVEKGKFCRTNFRNVLVIGTFITEEGTIAYWSALNVHRLTEQVSNTVFIQTTRKKNDKNIFGTDYKFVKVADYKKTGITWNGYGNLRFPITDIEKTIVDCFDQPQYSSGYTELIRVVKNTNMQADNVITYCKALKNIAVTKRIGFLVAFFGRTDLISFIDFAKKEVNTKYNLLDPQGTEKGEFVSEWKLRLNISKQELLKISNR